MGRISPLKAGLITALPILIAVIAPSVKAVSLVNDSLRKTIRSITRTWSNKGSRGPSESERLRNEEIQTDYRDGELPAQTITTCMCYDDDLSNHLGYPFPFSCLAPVQETSPSRLGNEKGCFYMNKQYPSGERIQTNEPCLNCTCVGNTLMCYLRVCPFVKPMGENCVQEMHVGDCCPKFWCPEVYPYATTEKPETEPKGCYLDGRYYDEGARIPMDPLKPCEVCYCIRNTSVCTVQECELKIDGCFPQYKTGSCCPSRYNCTEEAATTIPPGFIEEDHEGCIVNGVRYNDGELVPSADNCETCYCMKHEVVCAVQECKAPADNCIPGEIEKGQCCPTKYECPPGTTVPDFSTTYASVEDLAKIDGKSFTAHTGTEQDAEISSLHTTTPLPEVKAETDKIEETTESSAETSTSSLQTEVSELVTVTLSAENATFITGDLVSRPREPKITEVPEDMFSSVAAAKSTVKPVYYPSRPIPGEGICRHENRTYQSKEKIPSSDPCRLNCICLNSVVQCDLVECVLTPPESGKNCKVKKLAEECCPKYVCDTPDNLSTPSEEVTIKELQHEVTDEFEVEQKTTSIPFNISTEHKEPSHDIEGSTELSVSLSTATDESVSIEGDTSSETSPKSGEISTESAETTTDSGISTERDQTISTPIVTSVPDVKSTKVTLGISTTEPSTSEIVSTASSPTEETAVEDFIPKELSSKPTIIETSSLKSTSVFEESSAVTTGTADEELKGAITEEITTETKTADTEKIITSEKTTEADVEQTKEILTISPEEFELTLSTHKPAPSTLTDFTKTTSHLFSETTPADVEFKDHDITASTLSQTSISDDLSTIQGISEVTVDNLKTEKGSTTTVEQTEAQNISLEIKPSTETSQTAHPLATDTITSQKTTVTLSEEIKAETSTPIYITTGKQDSSELPDKHISTVDVVTTSSSPIVEEAETQATSITEEPIVTAQTESEVNLTTTTIPSKGTDFVVDISKVETTTAALTSEYPETKPTEVTKGITLFEEDVKEFNVTSEEKTAVTHRITEVEEVSGTEVTELPSLSSESTESELITEQQISHSFEETSPESLKIDSKVSTTEKPKIPELVTPLKTPDEESVDIISPQSTQIVETTESRTTLKPIGTHDIAKITTISSDKITTSVFEKTTEGYSTESKTDTVKDTEAVTEFSKAHVTEETQSFDAESVTSSEISDEVSEISTISSNKSSVSGISTNIIPEITTATIKDTFTISTEPTFETGEEKEITTPVSEGFPEITKVSIADEKHIDTESLATTEESVEITPKQETKIKTEDAAITVSIHNQTIYSTTTSTITMSDSSKVTEFTLTTLPTFTSTEADSDIGSKDQELASKPISVSSTVEPDVLEFKSTVATTEEPIDKADKSAVSDQTESVSEQSETTVSDQSVSETSSQQFETSATEHIFESTSVSSKPIDKLETKTEFISMTTESTESASESIELDVEKDTKTAMEGFTVIDLPKTSEAGELKTTEKIKLDDNSTPSEDTTSLTNESSTFMVPEIEKSEATVQEEEIKLTSPTSSEETSTSLPEIVELKVSTIGISTESHIITEESKMTQKETAETPGISISERVKTTTESDSISTGFTLKPTTASEELALDEKMTSIPEDMEGGTTVVSLNETSSQFTIPEISTTEATEKTVTVATTSKEATLTESEFGISKKVKEKQTEIIQNVTESSEISTIFSIVKTPSEVEKTTAKTETEKARTTTIGYITSITEKPLPGSSTLSDLTSSSDTTTESVTLTTPHSTVVLDSEIQKLTAEPEKYSTQSPSSETSELSTLSEETEADTDEIAKLDTTSFDETKTSGSIDIEHTSVTAETEASISTLEIKYTTKETIVNDSTLVTTEPKLFTSQREPVSEKDLFTTVPTEKEETKTTESIFTVKTTTPSSTSTSQKEISDTSVPDIEEETSSLSTKEVEKVSIIPTDTELEVTEANETIQSLLTSTSESPQTEYPKTSETEDVTQKSKITEITTKETFKTPEVTEITTLESEAPKMAESTTVKIIVSSEETETSEKFSITPEETTTEKIDEIPTKIQTEETGIKELSTEKLASISTSSISDSEGTTSTAKTGTVETTIQTDLKYSTVKPSTTKHFELFEDEKSTTDQSTEEKESGKSTASGLDAEETEQTKPDEDITTSKPKDLSDLSTKPPTLKTTLEEIPTTETEHFKETTTPSIISSTIGSESNFTEESKFSSTTTTEAFTFSTPSSSETPEQIKIDAIKTTTIEPQEITEPKVTTPELGLEEDTKIHEDVMVGTTKITIELEKSTSESLPSESIKPDVTDVVTAKETSPPFEFEVSKSTQESIIVTTRSTSELVDTTTQRQTNAIETVTVPTTTEAKITHGLTDVEKEVTTVTLKEIEEEHATTKEVSKPTAETVKSHVTDEPKFSTSTSDFKTSVSTEISKSDQKESPVTSALDAEVSTKLEDVMEVKKHTEESKTTLTEPSTTESEVLRKTEPTLVLEDTILSNKTFGIDSMVVAQSTTPITDTSAQSVSTMKEITTATFSDVSEISKEISSITDTSTHSSVDLTTLTRQFEPETVESITTKVISTDSSTVVPTKTEETPDRSSTAIFTTKKPTAVTEVSEVKSDQSTLEKEIFRTTSSILFEDLEDKKSPSEIPVESSVTTKDLISTQLSTEEKEAKLTATTQAEVTSEELDKSAETKKSLTTESYEETTVSDITLKELSPTIDSEEIIIKEVEEKTQTPEIFTEGHKTPASVDYSSELTTVRISEATELTTSKMSTEPEVTTSTEAPELSQKSTTEVHLTPEELKISGTTTGILENATLPKLTETSLEGEVTSLPLSTSTVSETIETFELKTTLVTPKEKQEDVVETDKTFTTRPTSEIETTIINDNITLPSVKPQTSELPFSVDHSETTESIPPKVTLPVEELFTDKTSVSFEEKIETTQESETTLREEFDDQKYFTNKTETSASPTPTFAETSEISFIPTISVKEDLEKTTEQEPAKSQEAESSKVITELTTPVPEVTVKTFATSTASEEKETTSDFTVQDVKEKQETSPLFEDSSATLSTGIKMTSEPIAPVTESTSSTATTTAEAVTKASTFTQDKISTTVISEVESRSSVSNDTTEDESSEEHECIVDGVAYDDGEAVVTVEPCEKCHCSSGEIVCFKIICKVPKPGCVSETIKTDECCPTSYKCPTDLGSAENETVTVSPILTEKDLSTPIPISFMFSTTPASISTTVLVSKIEDDVEMEKISTPTEISMTSSSEESPTTLSVTESKDRETTVGTIVDLSKSTEGTTEKTLDISESTFSSLTTSPSTIIPQTESVHDVSSVKPTEGLVSEITTEKRVFDETENPTVVDKVKEFETTATIYETPSQEQSSETTFITESNQSSIFILETDKTTTISSIEDEEKQELTTPGVNTTSISPVSASDSKETIAAESKITTKEISFETTSQFGSTKLPEGKPSTKETGQITTETEASVSKLEADHTTTMASALDEKEISEVTSPMPESSTFLVSSEITASTTSERSAETTEVESDTTAKQLSSITTPTPVDIKVKDVDTTVSVDNTSAEVKVTEIVKDVTVLTSEVGQFSTVKDETEEKSSTFESALFPISSTSTVEDKTEETAATTSPGIKSDVTLKLETESIPSKESTKPPMMETKTDSVTITSSIEDEISSKKVTLALESSTFTTPIPTTKEASAESSTKLETDILIKEISSQTTIKSEEIDEIQDFQTTPPAEKSTEDILISHATEPSASTFEAVNLIVTSAKTDEGIKSEATPTGFDSELTTISFPVSEPDLVDKKAETVEVIESKSTTELPLKTKPKPVEIGEDTEQTLPEDKISTEQEIKKTTLIIESTEPSVFKIETDSVTETSIGDKISKAGTVSQPFEKPTQTTPTGPSSEPTIEDRGAEVTTREVEFTESTELSNITEASELTVKPIDLTSTKKTDEVHEAFTTPISTISPITLTSTSAVKEIETTVEEKSQSLVTEITPESVKIDKDIEITTSEEKVSIEEESYLTTEIKQSTEPTSFKIETDFITESPSVEDEMTKSRTVSPIFESSSLTPISTLTPTDVSTTETFTKFNASEEEFSSESTTEFSDIDKIKSFETITTVEKISTEAPAEGISIIEDVDRKTSVFTEESLTSTISPETVEGKIKPEIISTTPESKISTTSSSASETTIIDKKTVTDVKAESESTTESLAETTSKSVETDKVTEQTLSADKISTESEIKKTTIIIESTEQTASLSTESTSDKAGAEITAEDESDILGKKISHEVTTKSTDIHQSEGFETTVSTEKAFSEKSIEISSPSDVIASTESTANIINLTVTSSKIDEGARTEPTSTSESTLSAIASASISAEKEVTTEGIKAETTIAILPETTTLVETAEDDKKISLVESLSTEVESKKTTLVTEKTGTPSTSLEEIKSNMTTLSSETVTVPLGIVSTSSFSPDILKTTESEKFDSTEKVEFETTTQATDEIVKIKTITTPAEFPDLLKLPDVTTSESEESFKTLESSTAIPIKLPKLDDVVTSTAGMPTEEFSTQKDEETSISTEEKAIEKQTTIVHAEETSQGAETTEFITVNITTESSETSRSEAETTTISSIGDLSTTESKITEGINFTSPVFLTKSDMFPSTISTKSEPSTTPFSEDTSSKDVTDATSEEKESSESFESFTETIQVNQTVVSASKEGTSIFEDERATDSQQITESDIPVETISTQKVISTTEDVQKLETTLQPNITYRTKVTDYTDEVFNFVSTRFTDIMKETQPIEDVTESKTPETLVTDDVKDSSKFVGIQTTPSYTIVDKTEKHSVTDFMLTEFPVTTGQETAGTEESKSNVSSEIPVETTKEAFTTKKPAIKSLEEVTGTDVSFENETTAEDLERKQTSKSSEITTSSDLIESTTVGFTKEESRKPDVETKITEISPFTEIMEAESPTSTTAKSITEEETSTSETEIKKTEDKLWTDIVAVQPPFHQTPKPMSTRFPEDLSTLETKTKQPEAKLLTDVTEMEQPLSTPETKTENPEIDLLPEITELEPPISQTSKPIITSFATEESIAPETKTKIPEAKLLTEVTEVTSQQTTSSTFTGEDLTHAGSTIAEDVTTHSPETKSTIGDKLETTPEENLTTEKDITLFTKQGSLSTESTHKDTDVTKPKEVSEVDLSRSTTSIEGKSTLTYESTSEKETEDFVTKTTFPEDLDKSTEATISETLEVETTTEAGEKPLMLSTLKPQFAKDNTSSQTTPTVPFTSSSPSDTESSLVTKVSSFTTVTDIQPESLSTSNISSVANVSDIEAKISTITPLIKLDLSSTISSLITTTVEELSTSLKDVKSTQITTEEPTIAKESGITTTASKAISEKDTQMPLLFKTTLTPKTLIEEETEPSLGETTTAEDTTKQKSTESSTEKIESSSEAIEHHPEEKAESVPPKSTEIPTKAYKAIETTPLPLTTLPTVTENITAETEEDFLLDEGACIFEGQIYQSAEQIVRADPCEFCFCFRGDIICLQQSCPPPAPNCHRTMIHGYCCPRYDCPVLVTSRNITTLTRRKGVQPIIIQRRIDKRAVRASIEVKGCQINGTFYEVGSTVTKASGPCLHCECQEGGNMRCDPQKCKPEPPLMLKMNNSFFRTR
ncbi:uncharacterized protein TNIN_88721 [Trichonephila inaurata madagascariensis]|uniref:VWFC domain-containing protein n=1 Tax=Trichonephila inaurata madagascariensis TaxID=2747483 RepID=A0A8X6XXN6_9ARAC|nr:uncharacterized protein TNIN_88721 [Trichonephila inaurata madagascariensis]